jgi:hypothetical protein
MYVGVQDTGRRLCDANALNFVFLGKNRERVSVTRKYW